MTFWRDVKIMQLNSWKSINIPWQLFANPLHLLLFLITCCMASWGEAVEEKGKSISCNLDQKFASCDPDQKFVSCDLNQKYCMFHVILIKSSFCVILIKSVSCDLDQKCCMIHVILIKSPFYVSWSNVNLLSSWSKTFFMWSWTMASKLRHKTVLDAGWVVNYSVEYCSWVSAFQ